MAGPVPAIHAFLSSTKNVDARNKPGHDESYRFDFFASRNHRWHAKFLARHSPLALTGDGRHFGRRGTTATPAARAAPSPDRGGFNDIDEVARRRIDHTCGAGDDVRRSLAQGG